MKRSIFLIHNIDAGNYFEILLLWAAISILGIRFYLRVTGYPQLGGGGFHIAHMLWGGFLMLGAIVLLLAFFGGNVKRLSAIIGGIGFGSFIDELGKFITRDNNYFFEPTIAFIYVIFVVLFLVFRFIQRRRKFSQDEYLANAFDLVRSAVLNEIDLGRKEKAVGILNQCDQSNPAVENLRKIIEQIKIKEEEPSLFERLDTGARNFYRRMISHKWFLRIVVLFFLAHSLFNLYRSSDIVSLYFRLDEFELSYIEAGKFISSIMAAIVAIFGMVVTARSRISGYRLFRDSVLISIFLTQFFDFYDNQFRALTGLAFNLFVLFVLEYMILQEERHQIPG